jgi:superfamily II DNA helicase RecQ
MLLAWRAGTRAAFLVYVSVVCILMYVRAWCPCHSHLGCRCAGYHQETGRAGRDGRKSDVVLYFSQADAVKGRAMLEDSAHNAGTSGRQQLKHNLDSLNAMVSYAADVGTCRRVILMKHFGEDFDAARCAGALVMGRRRVLWQAVVRGS